MQTDAYTSDAICQCMGLPSFDKDPVLVGATEAIRLLFKPSFHPEICITVVDGHVSVVCARWMVWRLFEPSPMLTDRSKGTLDSDAFARLLLELKPLPRTTGQYGIIIDGMPTEVLHFRAGELVLRVGGNAGWKGDFSAFIAFAVRAMWDLIGNVHCRNALADAAAYLGEKLPRLEEPARKPTVETVVLGVAEDRAELLRALKHHHNEKLDD